MQCHAAHQQLHVFLQWVCCQLTPISWHKLHWGTDCAELVVKIAAGSKARPEAAMFKAEDAQWLCLHQQDSYIAAWHSIACGWDVLDNMGAFCRRSCFSTYISLRQRIWSPYWGQCCSSKLVFQLQASWAEPANRANAVKSWSAANVLLCCLACEHIELFWADKVAFLLNCHWLRGVPAACRREQNFSPGHLYVAVIICVGAGHVHFDRPIVVMQFNVQHYTK